MLPERNSCLSFDQHNSISSINLLCIITHSRSGEYEPKKELGLT
jgi:hypothetical protein